MNNATVKDIQRCWYDEHEDGWVIRIRVISQGKSGIIRFGKFETKDEAKKFYNDLKNS